MTQTAFIIMYINNVLIFNQSMNLKYKNCWFRIVAAYYLFHWCIRFSPPSLCSHAQWTPAAVGPKCTSLSPVAPPPMTSQSTAAHGPHGRHPIPGPDLSERSAPGGTGKTSLSIILQITLIIITSTKEVVLSSAFVCLFVFNVAALNKKHRKLGGSSIRW